MQFKTIINRLKTAPDREWEQSLVRVTIATLMIGYCLTLRYIMPLDVQVRMLCDIAYLYLFFAFCIVAAITIDPKRYHLRRHLTMLFDVGMVTWAMLAGGECAAMLYVFFLWISLGNGFRFGTRSLYLTSGLSMIGFSIVILNSDFWLQQQLLGPGLMVGLLITSLYVTLLLKRLENEKLRAEAASMAKSRFLANMSHEIRTPLNGVVGMTDLLAGTPMGVEQREMMRTIQASAETLLNLIEDILDFSKIEAGKVEVSLQDLDIVQFINDILAMMQPSADAKSIKLNNLIDMSVPLVVRTDPQLLRQILINLLNNAIKFTEKGSVTLRVSPGASKNGNSRNSKLLFEVIDTGIGITESQQQRIFERFTQGKDAAASHLPGSGLGTTITKQLVELLGGEIGVESRLGEGSRFWFDLPALPGKLLIDDVHLDEAKVLLFADLHTDANQILDHLQEWQVITNVCSSVTDGFLELLNAEKMDAPFDIAIIDENQAGLAVEELVSAIRAESSLDSLAIICVRDAMRNGEDNGCSAIITTPVSAEKLKHALHYTLKNRRSGGVGLGAKVFKSLSQGESRVSRILLAEDNLINQKVVKKILELQGHIVDVVANGEEAISLLEAKKYDLAIVDLQMPDVGGIEVIKHYRAMHNDQQQMPFMIITANATKDAIRQCDDVGVSAYLTKPVRSSHLLEVVNRILGVEEIKIPAETLMDQPVRQTEALRDHQVLDLKTLADLEKLSKDPGFLQSMTDSFFRDSDELLVNMQISLEEGNLHQYRDCAHAIADNASGMGAFSLKTVCSAVSAIEKPEFDSHGVKMLAKISSTYTVTCQALHHYLQQRNQ
ncbi:MAG: ATP-binding protein [Candidatus Thiodiazotropha sp.]|nr:response regulator [Candidatus Thiodiazotropha sp. (ex Codakia orbicularis)]